METMNWNGRPILVVEGHIIRGRHRQKLMTTAGDVLVAHRPHLPIIARMLLMELQRSAIGNAAAVVNQW